MIASVLVATALGADCTPAPVVRADSQTEPLDQGCVFFAAEAAGAGFLALPNGATSRGVDLRRAALELGFRTQDRVQIRLLSNVERSGGPDGYIGVAGEALVPVIDVFEARWDLPAAGLSVAAGVVDEPWRMSVQPLWQLRVVAAPAMSDQGLVGRSDVGGWLGWTHPDKWVQVTVAALSGEGARTRERNNGVDLAAVVATRPIPSLELALYGREGSTGILKTPGHRAGAHALWLAAPVAVGMEGVMGWGTPDNGLARPVVGSLWARTDRTVPVIGWARVDRGVADLDTPRTGQTVVFAGAGPRLPFRSSGPASLSLGYEGRFYADGASELAGAAADTHLLSLMLLAGGSVVWGVP